MSEIEEKDLEIVTRVLCGELEESDPRFQQWIHKSSTNLLLFLELKGDAECPPCKAFDKNRSYERIYERLSSRRRLRHRSGWWRFAAAASFAAVLLTGGVFLGRYLARPGSESAVDDLPHFVPGGKIAYLQTSDAEKMIPLTADFTKVIEDGSEVTNSHEGVVSYSAREEKPAAVSAPVEMQKLSVPRGGEYAVTLSDGTRVHMNSESSLSFPSRFEGSERRVALTGEAFFEVSKGEIPFVVEAGAMEVKVMGTTFNLNAYPGASSQSATLVEGSVKVRLETREQEFVLKPDDHLTLDLRSNDVTVQEVDTRLYTSWTRGELFFRGQRLEDILTALSRWYNFDVEYKDSTIRDMHFTGCVEKFRDIDFLLDMVCSVSNVKYVRKEEKILLF